MAIAAVLACLIGAVLGLLGGGGSILMLPMLIYVANIDAKTAIAMSLLLVGATSLVGTLMQARTGFVQWRAGAIFGAGAMMGAFGGGNLAHLLAAKVLLALFGVIMLVTALAMLRRRTDSAQTPRRAAVAAMLLIGAAVGLLAGMVGAGGGFLIVPALTLLGGVALREAVGTSLLVITLQSFAGLAGHLAHVHLDVRLTTVLCGATILGTLVGTAFAKHLSVQTLRNAFAWLVLSMGIFFLSRQLSMTTTLTLTACTLVAAYVFTRPTQVQET